MIDVKLDENNDVDSYTSHVTGDDLVVQRLNIRLQVFEGEYVLDQSAGVPWIEWLSEKRLDLAEIRDDLRRLILETPGVAEIRRFSLEHEQEVLTGDVELVFESSTTVVGELTFEPRDPTGHPHLTILESHV